jgi:hypothetical protein
LRAGKYFVKYMGQSGQETRAIAIIR